MRTSVRRANIEHYGSSLETAANEAERDKTHSKCNACGGVLILMTEVAEHRRPDKRDRPSVRYFRCEKCIQIQITEE